MPCLPYWSSKWLPESGAGGTIESSGAAESSGAVELSGAAGAFPS